MRIEDKVFNLIIAMSKYHNPIRVSDTLQQVNKLISNTEYQEKLNSFKVQRCGLTEEDGRATLGMSYALSISSLVLMTGLMIL